MVYVGGKKKLAKYICPILQKELDTGKYSAYVEPFGGGGNIMENINFPVRYFYDINEYLIAFTKPYKMDGKCHNQIVLEQNIIMKLEILLN
jgi:site-specific DNA-adenine methylase